VIHDNNSDQDIAVYVLGYQYYYPGGWTELNIYNNDTGATVLELCSGCGEEGRFDVFDCSDISHFVGKYYGLDGGTSNVDIDFVYI
jgi:hypothetical protein